VAEFKDVEMNTVLGPYTVSDLLRLREETDDRLELIDGEIFVVPKPGLIHQAIVTPLICRFAEAIDMTGRGRVYPILTDVRLSEFCVVQPDLIVVVPGGGATIEEVAIVGPPALLVEIVIPASRVQDLGVKRALYARAGVPEYWVVGRDARFVAVLSDPADGDYRTETVYNHGEIARAATIPAVEIPTADLFRSPFERC
jgi:Uma2 family endonuclease